MNYKEALEILNKENRGEPAEYTEAAQVLAKMRQALEDCLEIGLNGED